MPTPEDEARRAEEQASTDAIRAGTEAVRAGTDAVRADTKAVQGDTEAVRAETANREAETDAIRAETERRISPLMHRGWLITILVITLLLNFVVAGLLLYTRYHQQQYIACAAKYDQEFATMYQARHQPLVEVDAAIDALILAVANEDEAGFQEALRNYVDVRENQEKIRSDNPLPPLPRALCGVPR